MNRIDRGARRAAPIFVWAVCLVVAAAGAWAQGASGLVPGGQSPDVLLMHTGDAIGYIEPCG